MKRLLLMIVLLAFLVFVLPAASDSFSFTLVLNKNGTDSVWFSESSDENAAHINRYVFPLVEANKQNTQVASGQFYLHWEKNSDRTVKIRLSFVGNESEDDSTSGGFMMWRAATKSDEKNGLNYDVKLKAGSGTGSDIGEFSFTSADARLTATSKTGKRTITFDPTTESTATNGTTGKEYVSPALITITVNPASSDDSGNHAYWGVEEQYVGYIKAEIVVSS